MAHDVTFFGDFLDELGRVVQAAASACRARDQIAEDQVRLAEKLAEAERELATARGLVSELLPHVDRAFHYSLDLVPWPVIQKAKDFLTSGPVRAALSRSAKEL